MKKKKDIYNENFSKKKLMQHPGRSTDPDPLSQKNRQQLTIIFFPGKIDENTLKYNYNVTTPFHEI